MVPLVLRNTVAILSTLEIGLIAGILLGTGMSAYTAKGLSETSWTLQFQLQDALFSKAMPPLMLSTLLILVITAVLGRSTARILFGASALLMLIVLILTIRLEVPINREIHSWTAGSVPVNWTLVRDRWLSNHILRTIAGIAAFGSALCGLLYL